MREPSEPGATLASPKTSHEFRLPAVAGFVAALCYGSAYLFFPKISDALNPDALDLGLSQLAAHPTLALVCQQLFAVADIAMIVFLFGLAALARPPLRALAWLGCFLFSLSFALDLLVVASVISATNLIAPHAAHDPTLHAAGIATLGFASAIDFREGYLWLTAPILLGVAAWRSHSWPRWLAVAAVLTGLLSFPYLPFFVSSVIGNIVFLAWVLGLSVLLWQQKPR